MHAVEQVVARLGRDDGLVALDLDAEAPVLRDAPVVVDVDARAAVGLDGLAEGGREAVLVVERDGDVRRRRRGVVEDEEVPGGDAVARGMKQCASGKERRYL